MNVYNFGDDLRQTFLLDMQRRIENDLKMIYCGRNYAAVLHKTLHNVYVDHHWTYKTIIS
jgi:hypothetical protein